MKRSVYKKYLAFSLVFVLGLLFVTPVRADAPTAYITLGADLTATEKSKVLELLEVKEADLNQYNVITVTNQDEHEYLDDYLSSSAIGSRALSSLLLTKKDEGTGISITTKNINYCTDSMYVNALSTAGVSDVNLRVVGPFEISGTAALVGAMKTYEQMTGKKISKESKDTATNELVVTSELGESLGNTEDATELLARVKEDVVSRNLSSKEDIKAAVKDAAEDMKLNLSDADEEKIAKLMEKVSDLDLNVNDLKEQAKNIYDKLSDLSEKSEGFFAKVGDWFQQLFDKLGSLFN